MLFYQQFQSLNELDLKDERIFWQEMFDIFPDDDISFVIFLLFLLFQLLISFRLIILIMISFHFIISK
jgi:hypothetical protein